MTERAAETHMFEGKRELERLLRPKDPYRPIDVHPVLQNIDPGSDALRP